MNCAVPEIPVSRPPTANHLFAMAVYLPTNLTPKPPERARGFPAGFTLLEVMVAMAIMAIVLVSVYRMHSQTLSMNAANRFYTQAPMLAQSKLAELEAGSSEIIAGDSGDFGEKFPGYTWNVSVAEISIEALGEVSNDLKQIDLIVSLNNDEFTYNVRTYRLIRE